MRTFLDISRSVNGDFSANFYMKEASIDLNAELKYPEHIADDYAAMFKSKLNKKFINYISNDDLGYMTYSVNSEALWHIYPRLIQETYASSGRGIHRGI